MKEGGSSDWQQADMWYAAFYRIQALFHDAMMSKPPNVEYAYSVTRQMIVHCIFALSSKKKLLEEVDSDMKRIRLMLFSDDDNARLHLPAVRSRRDRSRQESLDLLLDVHRKLYIRLHELKMLVPFSSPSQKGYGAIGPGGVRE